MLQRREPMFLAALREFWQVWQLPEADVDSAQEFSEQSVLSLTICLRLG